MFINHPARLCLLLFAAATLVMFSGCGRKASPVPPGTLRPVAIKDLSFRFTPQGVELSWTVPVRNHDGSPLVKIKEFHLFKAEKELEDVCGSCPVTFGQPIRIPFQAKPEEARKVYYEDRTLKNGKRYIYEVRTVKSWFVASDPSNRVEIAWHPPPESPRELKAIPVKGGIRLTWKAPERWANGKKIDKPLFYRIYRSRVDSERWKLLKDKTEKTAFFDKKAKGRTRYQYRVAALIDYHGTLIEGQTSNPVAIEPKDLIPPDPPKGLIAVAAKKVVELLWKDNREPDLAGYLIYRQDPKGRIKLLNNLPIPLPRYVDREKKRPGRYYYWVTAVDDAQPANESRPSRKASVYITK